jgi:hypothetical protein
MEVFPAASFASPHSHTVVAASSADPGTKTIQYFAVLAQSQTHNCGNMPRTKATSVAHSFAFI